MWFLMLWTWWMSLQIPSLSNEAEGATPSVDLPYDTGPVEEYAGPPR